MSSESKSKIIIAAFTHNGIKLALRLAGYLDARVFVPERFTGIDSTLEPIAGSLSDWTGKFFHESRALVFVSSCGIAVRAISAHVQSKLSDPAVIVIDESAKYVIPILSGHVGGANELAGQIAGLIDSHAVITTATDLNNIIAPDSWAVNHDCVIENTDSIKHVSARLLENLPVGVAVTDQIISAPYPVTLYLRPKVLVLGAGCNKGTDPDEFESSAQAFMKSSGASILSLKALASIDIKANEPALVKFSHSHKIPFITFSASELQELPGRFTSSQRVLEITGTDNICERACVKAAGENAVLLRSKFISGGMTFALARII
ncbi:MAG: cobalamin biosynthesis protein [Synergistaceae bacterium]|nr:cobalamin biosynthesis protein [Synergistaceae bacterium]